VLKQEYKETKPNMTGPVPAKARENALYDALVRLKTRAEISRFLTDLCTPGEIRALGERWQVARLLDGGDLTYRDINERTGVSTATIVRVARFLRDEPHKGYRLILDRLKKKS